MATRPDKALGLSLAAALVVFAACSHEPSVVFIPGPSFSQAIHLSTEQGERAKVRVNHPLALHAQRRTGPWVSARRDALAPEACWLGSPPPELEPEVADNLRWLVDPPGAATFNVEYKDDHTREVSFSEAGLYSISAQSAVWCGPPYEGNTLTVEVVADQPR